MNSSPSASSDFDQVQLGTFLQSACSPQFQDIRRVGIMIRMPESITIPPEGEGRFPLCITAQLTVAEIAGYRHVFEPANIVLVDDARGETITGSLWKDRTFENPPPPPMSAEEAKIITMSKFYNVNVLERLDLPRREARYHVYVTINKHKSNVAAIEVKVK